MSRAQDTTAGRTLGTMLDEGREKLAAVSETPLLDAEALLCSVLDRPRAWLLARRAEAIEPDVARCFNSLIDRRCEGWPVAYLIGSREFWSRSFRVTPDVLIPRPETEQLIETALAHLPADRECRIADLGTGSGNIAITLALERPRCRVVATDLSAAALAVARANAAALGASHVEFRLGEWCSALTEGERFSLIASNPPYVRAGDPHLDRGDLRFEPEISLVAGETGLETIERIATEARGHLADEGWLVIEHGFDQARAVANLLSAYGYTALESVRDIAGHPRIAAARHSGGAR